MIKYSEHAANTRGTRPEQSKVDWSFLVLVLVLVLVRALVPVLVFVFAEVSDMD